jgi:hypothetical protein
MTTQQINLFAEFENFIKPKLEHYVYLDNGNILNFKSLHNALNAYGQGKTRTLVEQLTDGSYLVFRRDLVSPIAVKTIEDLGLTMSKLC